MQVTQRTILVCLTTLLTVTSAQRPLDNSIQLDPEGTFRLDWSVLTNGTGSPTNPLIIFETHVKTRGWVSIRWTEGTNADFFWAGFDANSVINSFHYDMHCSQTGSLPSDSCISPTGPIADRVNDFRLEAEGFDAFTNSTIHRFDRLQDTGDVVQDIPIPSGPFTMGWAWSEDIILPGIGPAPIAKSGTATVTLIPL